MKLNKMLVVSLVMSVVFLTSCGGGGGDAVSDFRLYKMVVSDDAGVDIRIKLFEHDDSGLMVKVRDDIGADGVDDYVSTYEYSDGQLTEVNTDYDNDGVSNHKGVYQYSNNRPVKITFRNPASDVITGYRIINYNENNQVFSIELLNSSEVLYDTYKYIFYDDNLLKRADYGSFHFEEYNYMYNQQGRLDRMEIKIHESSVQPDAVATLFYEEAPCVIPEIKSHSSYYCSDI